MITITSKGKFEKTTRFFKRMTHWEIRHLLNEYGRVGVDALASRTPKDTGETADSWDYDVKHTFGSWQIVWTNSHFNKGVPIAIILQYGHGTGTGGYVEGIDYINPALKPVFQHIADEAWKEVTKN